MNEPQETEDEGRAESLGGDVEPQRSRFGGETGRHEAWQDDLADSRSTLLRYATWVGRALIIAAGLALILGIATFAVHFFVPDIGWLEDEEWAMLRSWYAGVAQTAFPVFLLLNPWLIWRLSLRPKVG